MCKCRIELKLSAFLITFFPHLHRSKKVADLAATLEKATLQKTDLELEIDELEDAARIVAVEEEQQASKKAPESSDDSSSSSDSSSTSSDSSSESSSESEESEAEEDCTESKEGGGGEMFKDNPPEPQPSASVSPTPQAPTSFSAEKRREDALPSASEGSRQLIQVLGERVAEELRISPDSSHKGARQPSSAATETEGTSGRSSGGTLLEPSPRRNPLLIVQTQQDPDDLEGDSIS